MKTLIKSLENLADKCKNNPIGAIAIIALFAMYLIYDLSKGNKELVKA